MEGLNIPDAVGELGECAIATPRAPGAASKKKKKSKTGKRSSRRRPLQPVDAKPSAHRARGGVDQNVHQNPNVAIPVMIESDSTVTTASKEEQRNSVSVHAPTAASTAKDEARTPRLRAAEIESNHLRARSDTVDDPREPHTRTPIKPKPKVQEALVAPPCIDCNMAPRSVLFLCCQSLVCCGRCMRRRIAAMRTPLLDARDLGARSTNLKQVMANGFCESECICGENWIDYGFIGARF